MILETIKQPADLRRLSYAELDDLAGEIRDFIVMTVSETAGHLGSNLGAVELTLALHRVFDSPRDAILWDTGHQAYVHKLVTGRQSVFNTLRQQGGLSGYPSRAESEHDFVENSHASTILSYAYGLAAARDTAVAAGDADVASRRAGRRIVAVIGDGSMTGGMAYEALNNLGHSGRGVIIVLNDNGRSYAPTVSNLSKSLTQVRLNPVYMRRQKSFEALVKSVPLVGPRAHKGMEALKAAIREMWEPATFFEPLGVRYMGPVDGHDVEALEKALRNAAEFDGPIVLHVLTAEGPRLPARRGRRREAPPRRAGVRPGGRASALGAGRVHAGVRRGDDQRGRGQPEGGRDHRGDARPDRIAALPGALARSLLRRRHRRAARGHRGDRHGDGRAAPRRRHLLDVHEPRVGPGHVRLRARTSSRSSSASTARASPATTGPRHHGVMDLALFTKVPGMTVFAPSSAQELQTMLHDALELDGPSVIRYPRGAARQVGDDEVGRGLKARLAHRATGAAVPEVCILAVGKLLAAAEAAASALEAEGVRCTVWDVRVVKPLDPEMIADAARHPLVVTVEDGIREGGAGSRIVDELARHVHRPRHPARRGARHADRVHPSRQARSHPQRSRARRAGHRGHRSLDPLPLLILAS